MQPDLIPDGHSRHVTSRVRMLPGTGRLPPLRVDELRTAHAAANDDRTSLVAGFIILGLVVATFIALGVAAFLLGKGA